MLTLTVVLAVFFLVVIPGLLLVLSLGRVASLEAPIPDKSANVFRTDPSLDRQIAGQLRLFHTHDGLKPRVPRADYS